MQRTVYHLIFRTVASEFLIATDRERDMYLRLLGDALRRSDWKCIAYAVMSNHIHLGMVAGSSPRSNWMRNAHSPFGEWIDRINERIGPVFIKKPTMMSVDLDGVANVVAYIHNNPVRAGVVSKARESSWSSHNAYLGTEKPRDWLRVELGWELMRVEDPAALDEFVNAEAWRPKPLRRKRGRPSRRRG
jgi:REP element-mobilizing transposase RayT